MDESRLGLLDGLRLGMIVGNELGQTETVAVGCAVGRRDDCLVEGALEGALEGAAVGGK